MLFYMILFHFALHNSDMMVTMETNFRSPLVTGCDCGFQLFNPVASLQVSHLGIYSDARFVGRSILMLDAHEEVLEELPEKLLAQFMLDAQRSIKAIKDSTGADRVNFAVLGNAVPHVHAHLIPRYREAEAKPNNSPWDDPRQKAALHEDELKQLVEKMRNQLMSAVVAPEVTG